MKDMFVCKRGRKDIQPGIAFLTTWVSEALENDWKKLTKNHEIFNNNPRSGYNSVNG
jgi:hypothetical protein